MFRAFLLTLVVLMSQAVAADGLRIGLSADGGVVEVIDFAD